VSNNKLTGVAVKDAFKSKQKNLKSPKGQPVEEEKNSLNSDSSDEFDQKELKERKSLVKKADDEDKVGDKFTYHENQLENEEYLEDEEQSMNYIRRGEEDEEYLKWEKSKCLVKLKHNNKDNKTLFRLGVIELVEGI
jgi:hypothetical protein